MNDLEAISKWLVPGLKRFFVIDGLIEDEAIIVAPLESEVTNHYLDGSAEWWTTYGIDYYAATGQAFVSSESEAQQNENVMDYGTARKTMEWVSEQGREKNFPQVDGAKVEKVENTSQAPTLAGVDETDPQRLAKYMTFFRVWYRGKL